MNDTPVRLGLLGARADRGGLAAQTREFHRHLQPERTLVVDLDGKGRGATTHAWYPDATVVRGTDDAIDPDVVDKFLDGLDAVWAAETPYRWDVFDRARKLGVRSYLHANPELWRSDYAPPDVVLAPTPWRLDLLPDSTRVLPFPVATDRLPYTQRRQARTFVHVAAPAMLDRNGTRLVLNAMRYVRRHIRLIVRGTGQRLPGRIGNVEVIIDRAEHEDYWAGWPPAGDVLLLPRRYAGQSLTINEAMSLGMPVVSLDVEPQRQWLPSETLVRASQGARRRMVGGQVNVADANPVALARMIDRLYDDDEMIARCSAAAGAHAQAISWDALLPTYQALFAAGQP